MGRTKCALAVALAFLLQRLLLVYLAVWGVCPLVLPPLICWLGMEEGPERGAECGFFGGILAWFAGCSLWYLPLLTLLGGVAGKVFPIPGGFWGKWARTLLLLVGMEGLLILGHTLTGGGLLAALRIAWPEGLLSAASFPLAAGLVKLSSLPFRRRGVGT